MDATYVNHMGHKFMIPAGAQVMYTGNQFAGYKMAGGNVVTAASLMAAATSAEHSYYNKTVGKTVGKIATPTVGKTVGKITTPTVGVVGVNAGIIAGQMAEQESLKETYVMHMGHKFMIPVGAHIMYDSQH
jgi:hypothetical protein